MKKPKIRLTLIDRKGAHPCHRGHKIGDSFDFDTQRGELCPMACHVAFPYIDILRYGGHLPSREDGTFAFCCPDAYVITTGKTTILIAADSNDGGIQVVYLGCFVFA